MKKAFISAIALWVATCGLAFAAPAIKQAEPAAAPEVIAHPWQLGFSSAASPVMEKLDSMHNILLIVITVITVFVLLVMIYICVRFNRKANPVPSKTTHNSLLEIIWTAIPILILVAIAIPSLRLHYYMQKTVESEMTLKVVGYQWYWHYEYPDHGGIGFDSYMKKEKELKPGEHRLLAVDNRLVVPVDTTIKVLVTGADVIHAFALPAFGVKRDGVPGRLNETWFKATRTGTFYGQCSELCGVGHGFMPIVVDVVSKDEFAKWVKAKQKELGVVPTQVTTTPGNPSDTSQKTATPITKPVKATQSNPMPAIEQQKKESAASPQKTRKAPEAH